VAYSVLVFKQVYRKFGFVIILFETSKMFLEAHVEDLPVWPIYFMLQSGQASW
jgi:hypothetical protein